jgi:hypothetical protein
MASAIRTDAIDGAPAFGRAVERPRADLTDAGRDPSSVDIQVEVPLLDLSDCGAVRGALEELAEFESLGATWALAHVDGSSDEVAANYLAAFAEIVIAPRRAPGGPHDAVVAHG